MDVTPEETALSCSQAPSPTIDKLIEAAIRTTIPVSAARILQHPTVRRRSAQPAHEDGAPYDLRITIHASPRSNSTRSASTDPWSASGFFEEEPVMDRSSDSPEDFDTLLEPKLEEPEEDDVRMDDLQVAESMSTLDDNKSVSHPKKKRGRPRKHPVQTVDPSAKVQKGRSKTGCITCRRRKKKCDETKPACVNCEKNSVICEGYPTKTFWQPGRDRGEGGSSPTISQTPALQALMASTAQFRRGSMPSITTLAPIIHGVETSGDRMFLEHYCYRLSAVLTVEGPRKNAFKDILLPLAVKHLGLMHSILALSSSNIDYQEPYGKELLAKHSDVNEEILNERSLYHQNEAWKSLKLDIERQNEGVMEDDVLAIRYGQMLCLVVQNIAEGKADGEHRIHLKAYQNMIHESPLHDGPFMQFVGEYFQFHIGLDDIISLPQGHARLGAIDDDWNLPAVIQPEAVRLLGVQDGLFFYMSKITSIRNQIRSNMELGVDPVVDYTSLYRAAEIDAGIREWSPSWPEGNSRDLAGLLYKQMMWVYLWRTIYPPKTTTWQPEYKITSVVNQGIELLKWFPPMDPIQTLLLAPTFIIGCAAFDPGQRGPIKQSIANIKAYTNLKNADRALEVLQEVWKYMDCKDERSWDWQSVAHNMGMDFLAT